MRREGVSQVAQKVQKKVGDVEKGDTSLREVGILSVESNFVEVQLHCRRELRVASAASRISCIQIRVQNTCCGEEIECGTQLIK